MIRNSHSLVGVAALTVSLSSLMAPSYAAQAVIDQKGLKFVPNTMTINVGDTIRFTNSDPFTHDVTVVGPSGTPSDKGLQHHGQDLTVTFPEKGTFSIICTFHPNMKATVIVK
ncbi:MAG TPA: plastocyanin/azurin family copper-binding protein [Rhizomicrobium sp.]|nr:plastocyanin/azurin family copper-binding protein [Rhizomicrobium sp.]